MLCLKRLLQLIQKKGKMQEGTIQKEHFAAALACLVFEAGGCWGFTEALVGRVVARWDEYRCGEQRGPLGDCLQ